MLTKNVWQSQGLYNGSLGTVRRLVFNADTPPPSQPYCIDEYIGPSAVRNSERPIVPVVPMPVQFDEASGKSEAEFNFHWCWVGPRRFTNRKG
jgi:hypothetical protein